MGLKCGGDDESQEHSAEVWPAAPSQSTVSHVSPLIARSVEPDAEPHAPILRNDWNGNLSSQKEQRRFGNWFYQAQVCNVNDVENDNEEFQEDISFLARGRSLLQTRPWLLYVALGLLCSGLILLHAFSSQGTPPDNSDVTRTNVLSQKQTPPKFWLMCPRDGECVWFRKPGTDWIYKVFERNAWDVSNEIDDQIYHLRAIPQDLWNSVRSQWIQSPPKFKGKPVTLPDLAGFMRETLRRDPFWTGGQKVPWLDLRGGGSGASSQKQAVILNQRQLAFIVINLLMDNHLQGVRTGLDAAIQRCNKESDLKAGLSPDMLHAILAFLATLSQELGDTDGPYLVGTTPGAVNEAWLEKVLGQHKEGKVMIEPKLCNTAKLQAGTCGLRDFMAGGTPKQALTDIAGMDVGGGAQLCRVANSQDESLVIFYPEVLVASFFVGHGQMLPVPFTMLGARRYLRHINGETGAGPPYDNLCGKVSVPDFLNSNIMTEIADTKVSMTPVKIYDSSFVAVASYCSDCHRGDCSEPEMFNNQCDNQRKHLDEDVSTWLQAYDYKNYHDAVSTAFAAVVTQIGTGPWGAGLWQGDAQQYFLTVWLATSLLDNVQLDYYIYDHFCENAGHQCFVLGQSMCQSCIQDSGMKTIINNQYCGNLGAQDMLDKLVHQPVEQVYWLVKNVGPPPHQVFDLIGSSVM